MIGKPKTGPVDVLFFGCGNRVTLDDSTARAE